MKTLRIFLLLIFGVVPPLSGQWFEQFIYLPDSFGGFYSYGQAHIVWNSLDDRLYLFGRDANTIIIDCRTDEKIGNPFIRNSNAEPFRSCYNPINNCIYIYYHKRRVDSIGAIVIFDCASNRVVDEIPFKISNAPHFLLVNSINNRLYSPVSPDSLLIIDGQSNQIIGRVRIGVFSREPIWNPNNNLLYLFTNGSVITFDCNTNQTIDTIIISPYITGARFPAFIDLIRNKIVFYALWEYKDEPKIFVLDCVSNQITDTIFSPVEVSSSLCDFNPITNKLYECTYGAGDIIYSVDLSRRTIDTIPTGRTLGFVRLICNPSTNQLVGFSDCLVIIDCNSNQIIDTIPYEYHTPDPCIIFSIFLHPFYNKLYFPCEPCHLAVFDVSVNYSERYKKMIKLGMQVIDLLWNPLTNRLYCSDKEEPMIYVIDGATNRHRGVISLRPYFDAGVGDLEVATQMNKIYASCGGGYLVTIDGNTDSVIRVINRLPDDVRLAYNPNNNKLYGTLRVGPPSAAVYIIDCSTDRVIGEINTTYPRRAYINSLTNKVYLTNYYYYPKTLIVDGAGDTVIKVLDSIGGLDIVFRYQDNRIYIAGSELFPPHTPCLTVLDGWADTIVAQISNPNLVLYALAYDSIDDRIYCFAPRDSLIPNGIWVLDCQTNHFIDSIPDTLPIPWLSEPILFWNSLNNKLYYEYYSPSVGSYGGKLIRAVDCRTNQKITQFHQIQDACRPIAWNSIDNRFYVNSKWKSKIGVIRDFPSGVEEGRFDLTIEPKLEVSQPNPFSKLTLIRFQIARRGMISLKVYDTGGKLIKTLKQSIENPGEYSFIWDGTDANNNPLASGIYFLRLMVKDYRVTKKIILAK